MQRRTDRQKAPMIEESRRRRRRPRAARGQALLMTMILLTILAAAIGSMFVTQTSAVKATGDMLGSRQAFYACDGMSRTMVSLSQEYLKDVVNADGLAMAEHVCQRAGMSACTDSVKLPSITPPGFTVESFDVDVVEESFTAPLPGGPFQGMNARQTPVSLSVRAAKDSTGHACESKQEIVLAQVGLFQFFVFAEDFVDVYNGPEMEIDGRVHVNGDFCGHRWNESLRIKTLTASGDIFAGSSSCPRSRPTGDNSLEFWDGSSWKKMDKNNDHGCTGGAGCSGGWEIAAVDRWNGNVLDSAHDVPVLKVPVSGEPPVQDGLNAVGDTMDNASTQRFLIDPPLFGHEPVDPSPPPDTQEIRRQKFACKADIRIINGVWFKRTAGDETCNDWPGTPIWSDHPGQFSVDDDEEEGIVGVQNDIGQQDIADAQGWGTNVRPNRYSFYEATNSGVLIDDLTGVVSYGNIFRDTGVTPDEMRPGLWVEKDAFCEGFPTNEENPRLRNARDFACDCAGTSCTVDRAANYLQGTRGGFIDPRVENGTSRSQARILPMNFDISELADALADSSPGELGSYFGAAPFNGIIWITNTWDGQLDGLGNTHDDLAALWPNPVGDDSAQPVHAMSGTDGNSNADKNSTDQLPYPLCGKGSSVGLASSPSGGGPATPFKVPDCSKTARPSALRLINGYTIDPVVFPKGLSIVTNLPAYIVGDFNKHSDDDPDDWRPALVAADALTLLSNAYNDTEAGWDNIDGMGSSREAEETHYRLAIIAGDVSTAPGGKDSAKWSGGINNFPRFMEDWENSTSAELHGSMVIGFRSVFQRQQWCEYGTGGCPVYTAPSRDWFYDDHFDVISNQPPGAPVYEVQAIRRWSRN